ncbi:hypothetical protein RS130_23110 [Paraglaciecola aquimarina]|uniref:Uncharacterized protein n=1 Tax=Paraglaciecola aquimarina TaxID=1235557 RepID=A0ABU3T2A9_9ALTE|nr:hypothetical protein [Paraglaciecola aquimarina]MDU0356396.1 hypothetical protein [Paraglaciecola aquimarina]
MQQPAKQFRQSDVRQSHYDTSTQAMTEVALGLSMAFFALLILALISIGLPEQTTKYETKPSAALPDTAQLKLTAENPSIGAEKSQLPDPQYVFYFANQFYDKQLKPLNINTFVSFSQQQPLILAVQDNLPMLQVMTLRKQINHPNLSITMLNESWLQQLEKIQ